MVGFITRPISGGILALFLLLVLLPVIQYVRHKRAATSAPAKVDDTETVVR